MKYFTVGVLMVITALCISSCGPLSEIKYKTIKIHNNEQADMVFKSGTIQMLGKWYPLTVPQQKEPLQIIVLNPSLENDTIAIKSRANVGFYLNPFNYLYFIDDKHTPRQYKYPSNVYVRKNADTKRFEAISHENVKGDLMLHVSLPQVNSFLLHPEGFNYKTNTGFLGIALGADYYYKTNKYFNVTVGAITDFVIPIPVPITYGGPQEVTSSVYVTASDNFVVGSFTFGYGLLVTNNSWKVLEFLPNAEFSEWLRPVTTNSLSTGFVVSTYARAGERFHIGLVYRPSVFRLHENPSFNYEHSISLDLAWKFKL